MTFSFLPGRHDIGAVLELYRLGAQIVPLRVDRPRVADSRWRHCLRRVGPRELEAHPGGYGMVLAILGKEGLDRLSIVDVDRTNRGADETKAAIEALVGGPPAEWMPSRTPGRWHGVYVAYCWAKHLYNFEFDGIGGQVLTGEGAYISLWQPRQMISAVRKVRSEDAIILDYTRLPKFVAPPRRTPASPPLAPDVADDSLLESDLFRGAVGATSTLHRRWPVRVDDSNRVCIGFRNLDLFDQARAFAYPRAVEFDSVQELQHCVFEYATSRSYLMHVEPLPASEILDTARSISNWTWPQRRSLASWRPGCNPDYSPEAQSWSGKLSGFIRNRRNTDRDWQIVWMVKQGIPRRVIEGTLGVSRKTVYRVAQRGYVIYCTIRHPTRGEMWVVNHQSKGTKLVAAWSSADIRRMVSHPKARMLYVPPHQCRS